MRWAGGEKSRGFPLNRVSLSLSFMAVERGRLAQRHAARNLAGAAGSIWNSWKSLELLEVTGVAGTRWSTLMTTLLTVELPAGPRL